jgi:RHS repeat-associated protein
VVVGRSSVIVSITSTANDREKFATYTRDSYTGLDYANQRYFASTYGRFNTVDPGRSAKARSPLSWNRYSYTRGDPVNRMDPSGLDDSCTDSCDLSDDGNTGLDYDDGSDGGGGGSAQTSNTSAGSNQSTPPGQTAASTQNSSQSPAPACPAPQTGLGVVLQYGASADAGLGGASSLGNPGATVQGSVGVGAFTNGSSASAGVLATTVAAVGANGKSAGTPTQSTPPSVSGLFAGYGPGVTITNAGSLSQYLGPFNSLTFNAGFLLFQASINISTSGPVWAVTISGGPAPIASGVGFSYSSATTNTVGAGASTSHCP